jgi:hypothetical protein
MSFEPTASVPGIRVPRRCHFCSFVVTTAEGEVRLCNVVSILGVKKRKRKLPQRARATHHN